MKRLLLALPPAFLLLSLDRLGPTPGRPPAPAMVRGWGEAAAALPAVDEGRFGAPGDPLNLVFVATPQTLRLALTQAGWTEVPLTIRGSLSAGIADLLAGRRLSSFPPFNDYSLRGRRQDMNWALPIRPILERHHFRLWWTGMFDARGRGYWWGSGNYDLSVRWVDLSHRPDPDMDRERDFVLRTLSASPFLETAALMPMPQIPREGANDKGYEYRTDGRAGVLVLRGPADGVIRLPAAAAAPSASSGPAGPSSAPLLRPTPTP